MAKLHMLWREFNFLHTHLFIEEAYWRDIGGILEGYWRDLGGILEGYWRDIGGILEGYWRDIGGILEGYWRDIGGVLEGYWRGRIFILDVGTSCGTVHVNVRNHL